MQSFHFIAHVLAIMLISPLISGIITKIKNNLRLRKGPGIFQPYFNLMKYFSKDEVVSEHASWIFRAAPYIVLASCISAAAMVPLFAGHVTIDYAGDLIAVIFLLSLGRFFLALAGLDPATTFGGMGASREMFISSFAEPVAILSVFAVALSAGTTNTASIAGLHQMTAASVLAVAALFLVMLAETSRLPVDNQETHLELTMIHEAMILEHSGRSLALLELAAYVKQAVFFSILSLMILPGLTGPLFFLGKLLAISAVVAFTEVSMAKMRLFRVVDFLAFAGILSILAVMAIVLGV